jgi:acetyl-CoA C-acetyltransferase
MPEALIFDHVRTPRGKGQASGALHEVPAIELATQVLIALRERNHLDTAQLNDVILGVVTATGDQGGGIPRVAALNAGFAETVAGVQLNRYCSSGLDAVNIGAAGIMAGQSRLVIAGGVESMSRVPMRSDSPRANDPAVNYKTYYVPQGIGADLLATLRGHSRRDVDAYAVESQRRAARAWEEGYFAKSVVPVVDELGLVLLEKDQHVRPGTTVEDLGRLSPVFAAAGEKLGYDAVAQLKYPAVEFINHVHTAGNSCGMVDGAAGLILGDREIGRALGLKARARIRAFASIGSEPTVMLTGPAPASRRALQNAGMSVSDIDLFEVNEAFASVALCFMEDLDIPHDRVNVNGGAIALGHPLGATGAMLLGTVLDELERTDKSTALVTLCVGGGMGTATIIERV